LVLLTDTGKGEPPPGLIIFFPVYRARVAPGSVADRRAALQGFVYGSVRASEMLQGIFGGQLAPGVDFEVYEGTEPSRDRLLFDQDGVPNALAAPLRGELSRSVRLEVPGRAWTLYFSTRPAFHHSSTRYTPLAVLAGGMLVSAFAFAVALSLARARASAERIMADRGSAEEQLRQANERFELAASAVLGAIYDRDLERNVLIFTEGLTEVFGYADLVHSFEWWLERVHPEDRDRIYDPRHASANAPLVAEYRFRASDGRYLDVWDRGRAVRDASGRVIRLVGNMLDITHRKRAEALSRESQARHQAVLESSLDAVVTMNHEGRITEFNAAAERMFGYSRDAAVGQELASLIIPPSLRDRHRRGLARYLATGEPVVIGQRLELPAFRADGSELPVELTVTRVPVEGPPVFTAFVRDMSDRKAADKAKTSLEEQLRQAQKMEAVGRLAGGVAHDFNNLLTVISGRVHLLLSRLKPGEPMRRDAELIQKTAQRAVALTGQLLAFSRKQVLQPRVLDLNKVAVGMEPLLRGLIGEDVQLMITAA
ncbi:MAG TPA: PAS domain S-box protein, partial [Gemmatimonadales bacterium]|nr:PAS domain S-box protein [Gemmatimonadales bacterium]